MIKICPLLYITFCNTKMGDLIEYLSDKLSLDGDKGALEIRFQSVWNVVE